MANVSNISLEYSEKVNKLSSKYNLPSDIIRELKYLLEIIQDLYLQSTKRQLQMTKIVDHSSSAYLQLMCEEDRTIEELDLYCNKFENYTKAIEKSNYIIPIKVMCVVLSMTTCEATSLKNSFNPVANDLFESLQIYNIHDITDYYHEKNREEWIPYAHANHFESEDSQQCSHEPRKSIRTIISNLITKFNEESNHPIEPNFVTEEFFNSAPLWEEIRKQGGIIIVDAVSLLHEKIKDVLLQSSVIGHEKISILAISPINPCSIQTNQVLESYIKNKFKGLDLHFQKPFNRRCEIARGDSRSINTWFYSILHEKIQPQATAGGRSYMGSIGLPDKKGFDASPFKQHL